MSAGPRASAEVPMWPRRIRSPLSSSDDAGAMKRRKASPVSTSAAVEPESLDDPFGGGGDVDAPLAIPGQCGDPGDRLGYSPNLRSQLPRLPSEMGVGWQHLFRMRLYVMGSVPSDDDRTCRDVRGEPLLAGTAAEAISRPLSFTGGDRTYSIASRRTRAVRPTRPS